MINSSVVLSILVISHNQKQELHRCLESVLHQQLHFPFEVIVSDDASSDGTWELIQDYVVEYPKVVFGFQVNSDDCKPTNTSERSGHNRANAYRKARGKYFVHIDGDDYLRSQTIYQQQVELLEQHPDCSMCMENVLVLTDGSPLNEGRPWYAEHKFETGRVISAKEFLLKNYFIVHSAFVYRRNPDINPANIYGKKYVDAVITYHHLQFGNIVCLDACDYIYVKYPSSITNSLTKNDQSILWGLAFNVYMALLIPKFTGLYYAGQLKELVHLVNLRRQHIQVSSIAKNNFKQYSQAFIYRVFLKDTLNIHERIRLEILRYYLVVLIRTSFVNAFSLRLLHFLLVSTKIDKHARFDVQ